ncbi:MAG: hypothetical protein EPO20_14885 [Betaproteobacteria bacterium]|nr:MAG: hypothetical protein EPO20_14885 [Betaproteobacteria bacterium]
MPRQYRTLGELRAEMRAMLGAAASGAAAGPNSTIIDTHLRNAQTALYWTHDWAHLRRYETKTLGQHATRIDYPVTADPDRIRYVSVLRGGVWSPPLKKGITPSMYTYQTNYSWPQRWEPYDQMEFWPAADQEYSVRIFFIKAPDRFTQDADRASVDDTAISLVATGTLKSHYRQPDAKVSMDAADALLIKLKGKSWGQDVFRKDDWIESEPLVRPETV